jgi:uncharacterized protein (TIGR00645 family)
MPKIIKLLDQVISSFRWVNLAFYIGLFLAAILYTVHYVHEVIEMWLHLSDNYSTSNILMLSILELIDMSLINQLIVMTAQGGYAIFIKEAGESIGHRPRWLTKNLGPSEQKIKLGQSILGIMSVNILHDFIQTTNPDWNHIHMQVAYIGLAIAITIALCWVNLLMHHPSLNHDHSTNKENEHDKHD